MRSSQVQVGNIEPFNVWDLSIQTDPTVAIFLRPPVPS
jgi:hypothetical protein